MPLLIAQAAVAFLQSSLGHAGASGHIAVPDLAGLPAVQLRQLIGAVLLLCAWNLLAA